MGSVLVLSGSARRGSWNTRLAAIAATKVNNQGGQATHIDLRDYPMPLYNQDLEEAEGLPPAAVELKQVFAKHRGLWLTCPEYNGSITPLLKNTIDWLSRRHGDEPPLAAFKGKIGALSAASPGTLGGLRGLVHVRTILSNIGILVLPNQVAVPKAYEALAADEIADQGLDLRLDTLAAELVDAVKRFGGGEGT